MPLYLDGGADYKSAAIRVVKSTDLNQDAATPVLDVIPSPGPPAVYQNLQAVVNTSADVHGVKVQMWAMAFGTGSTPYLTSWGGTAGVELPAGGGIYVPANTQQTFSRDWDQTRGLSAANPEIAALLGNNTEFHCCIKANVFAVDAQDNPVEGVRLGPSPTLDFNDPHQAQRNMTIETHATGKAMTMVMFAGNTDGEREQPVKLLVKDRPLRRLPRLELVELMAIAPWIRPSREKLGAGFLPGFEVVLDDGRFPIAFAQRPLDHLQLELGDECGPELELVLPPAEPHRMLMRATLPDKEFVLHSVDLTQIEHDEVVGEAHVLLLSVPKELIEESRTPGYTRA